jgi:hypothetical protein
VRGRMAELTSQRDPRTRRRDRRLYARSSAKDLLERTLAQGHALRGAGGRGAQAIARRGTTGQGAIDELLAGGLARTASLTDALRPGRARQLIGGEGPERRRRHDPETDGRSVRLPRRLRAQERRMARACDRAAAALVRHLRATPAPSLLAELSVVETQLRERHAGLQRADRAYLARLAGAHHRTAEASGRLPAVRADVAP